MSKSSGRGSYQSRRAFLSVGAAAVTGIIWAPYPMAAARESSAAVTLRGYQFIPPHQWQVMNMPDHILLTQSPDQQGCTIQILPLQSLPVDLESYAKALFETMYRDWNYSKTGEQQYLLAKGLLPSGHEYFMMEADMSVTDPNGRYLTEGGVALAVKAGDQVAIVAVRHRSLLAHSDCLGKYETWRRFFNSFAIKDVPPGMSRGGNATERIVGVWAQAEHGVASAEYAFSANGRYAFSGALGSSWTTNDANHQYLHVRTHSFQGDGRYEIAGDRLTLTKHRGGTVERAQFRFDQVNHGGMGWKDRLRLLMQDGVGQFEARYEKKQK